MSTAAPTPVPVAEIGTLRRIATVAALLAAAAAAAYLLRGDGRGALALTLAAGASIVGFRGLEGVVRRLQADPEGGFGAGGGVRFLVRWLLILATLGAALYLGSQSYLAVLLGLTALPLAVIAEALLQLIKLGRPRER
jgi:hypothetical protein